MLDYIDELLKTENRTMTYDPGLIMCGATGNRVYGSFSMKPCLCGVFHFVHKSDFIELLELDFKEIVCPLKLKTDYVWMPSHIYMKHFYPCFIIEERKYITENDLIVSQICIKSVSGSIKFKLGLKSKILDKNFEKKLELFNQSVHIKAFCSDNEIFAFKEIALEQDQEFHFAVACGFKVEKDQWPAGIPAFEQHKAEYGAFYKGVPKLTCSDKKIEKVYYYRWFLLRHHISKPNLGNIKYPLIYEGRYGYFREAGLNEDEVIEWEFSKGILASVPHHLLDMRWHKSADVIKGEVLNFTENFGKMETFLGYEYDIPLLPGCIRIHDFVGHYFFHMIPYVVWQIYESINDKEWLERIVPALWEDLNNWGRNDPDHSGLPVMVFEGDSAMEFGPASHYHCKDKAGSGQETDKDASGQETDKAGSGQETDKDASGQETDKDAGSEVGLNCSYETEKAKWGAPVPNHRTEVATFYGLNYFAFYKIYVILDDKNKAEYCLRKYNSIKEAVVKHMWNEKENYFVELSEDFRQIEDIKQIGGAFCLFLVDPENPQGFLDNLEDDKKFKQKYGIASTSKDSFGYFPNNTVNGTRAHTCMWNGPAWPFSSSLALLAVGSFIKRMESTGLKDKYIKYFKEEFEKYTRLHFLSGNEDTPRIVEHYNCETGMPLSGQDDYNHSCYIDIFIRHVCGLDIDDNGYINFSPINMGIEYFKIEDIYFKNACYSIEIKGNIASLHKDGKNIKRHELSI